MIYVKECCGLSKRPVKIINQIPQMKTYSKELTSCTNLIKQNTYASRARHHPSHFWVHTWMRGYVPTIHTRTVIRWKLWSQADSLQQISTVSADTWVRKRRESACLATQVSPPGLEPGACEIAEGCMYTHCSRKPRKNSHCRIASANNIMCTLTKKKYS